MLSYSNSKSVIKTVIVEDNPDSLSRLKSMLKEISFIHVLGEAGDGVSAVRMINRLLPDLIFLDIHLPDMDGFDVLTSITHDPAVIFATAFDQYALKAFDANGIDYILKPVGKERLLQAVEKVRRLTSKSYDQLLDMVNRIVSEKNKRIRFSISQGEQILVIPQEEVFYFRSEERYVFLCTYDNKYFYNSSLKKLEQSLDPDVFVRIDKSVIVSLDKIKCLKRDYLRGYKVVVGDKKNSSLKVSRNCLGKVREKLDNL
jgi:two-component system, LytTR family, response regulator LytT